jgi:hypothetical protein
MDFSNILDILKADIDGKVWKLGKSIEHIHKNMRSKLQSQGKYGKI